MASPSSACRICCSELLKQSAVFATRTARIALLCWPGCPAATNPVQAKRLYSQAVFGSMWVRAHELCRSPQKSSHTATAVVLASSQDVEFTTLRIASTSSMYVLPDLVVKPEQFTTLSSDEACAATASQCSWQNPEDVFEQARTAAFLVSMQLSKSSVVFVACGGTPGSFQAGTTLALAFVPFK